MLSNLRLSILFHNCREKFALSFTGLPREVTASEGLLDLLAGQKFEQIFMLYVLREDCFLVRMQKIHKLLVMLLLSLGIYFDFLDFSPSFWHFILILSDCLLFFLVAMVHISALEVRCIHFFIKGFHLFLLFIGFEAFSEIAV